MITTQNYFQKVKDISPSALPKKLKEGYEFVQEVTENHTTWDYYKSDPDIKGTVDEYLANLSQHIGKSAHSSGTGDEKLAKEAAKKLIRAYVKRGDTVQDLKAGQTGTSTPEFSAMIKGNNIHVTQVNRKKVNFSFPLQRIYNEIMEEKGKQKTKIKSKPMKPKQTRKMPQNRPSGKSQSQETKAVERIDDEVRFIKRYALLHGKEKTDMQILNFVNTLQKAILERRIRKTSPYAKEIEYIQEKLVKLYKGMNKKLTVKIDKEILERFLSIAGSEKVRLSITYLKRYVGIQGKKLTKEKAQKLIDLMQNAARKRKLTKDDPYAEKLNKAFESLATFVQKAKGNDTLEVHPAILNGINEAFDCSDCLKKKSYLIGRNPAY